MTTKKLYDMDAYATEFEAMVLSCKAQESINSNGDKGTIYEVILDQTLFFPEEGGQTPDRGVLGEVEVLDVQLKSVIVKSDEELSVKDELGSNKEEVMIHLLAEPLEVGTVVKGKIDWQHRFFNMQQHSGEHLFSGLAYKKYGYKNVGFHLSNQIVTMDFDGTFTDAQIQEMEWEVNKAIIANVEIKTGYPSKEELAKMEYRSKMEIDGAVRIVEIPGYDMCACCAPHVHRTGEIGMFKIQSVQNYKGGMRISFLCGFRALEEYRKKAKILFDLSGILTTNQENLPEHVNKLKTQVQSLKTQLGNAKQALMEQKIAEIPLEQKDVILFERDLETPVMRAVVNQLVEKHEGICAIFVGDDTVGYNFIIGSKNMDCREIATKLRTECHARGGGSAKMVQGSVMALAENLQNFFYRKNFTMGIE